MATTTALHERLELVTVAAEATETGLAEEVAAGLDSLPRTLPCSYFYDETGSRLFEEISELPEYYLTRTESSILAEHAGQIADSFPSTTTMVELGSGSSSKTRLLIEAFLARHGRLRYVPLDISPTILEESALDLVGRYPALDIIAIAADYHAGLKKIPPAADGPRLIVFLGSTIGNFEAADACSFLSRVRATMSKDDRLLLGADRKKDPAILEQAYDDSQGVTASFNLNILTRINRELDADFDLSCFSHRAMWVAEHSRIEMHLVSLCDQVVRIGRLQRSFELKRGEYIHTENSHKYSLEHLDSLATTAGLSMQQRWSDSAGKMAVSLFAPK